MQNQWQAPAVCRCGHSCRRGRERRHIVGVGEDPGPRCYVGIIAVLAGWYRSKWIGDIFSMGQAEVLYQARYRIINDFVMRALVCRGPVEISRIKNDGKRVGVRTEFFENSLGSLSVADHVRGLRLNCSP